MPINHDNSLRKAAHSSKPEEGINAINRLLETIACIEQKFQPSGNTFYNICKIAGGVADNVIPDIATAVINLRIDPKDRTDYVSSLKAIVGKNVSVTSSLLLPGVYSAIPRALNFLRQKGKTVTYASELSAYRNGIIFGPGDIAVAHSQSECITKKELLLATNTYEAMLTNYTKAIESIG